MWCDRRDSNPGSLRGRQVSYQLDHGRPVSQKYFMTDINLLPYPNQMVLDIIGSRDSMIPFFVF